MINYADLVDPAKVISLHDDVGYGFFMENPRRMLDTLLKEPKTEQELFNIFNYSQKKP